MGRIDDKIEEIEQLLDEFKSIIPSSFEEYNTNLVKAANERYFERIVESLIDLSFLVIKNKKFRIPEDDFDSFSILFENKLIDNVLLDNLKLAKGMRNIIVHQYTKVDDEMVYEAVTQQILKDAEKLVSLLKKLYL